MTLGSILFNTHRIIGERVLPPLIVLAAIWFYVVRNNQGPWRRAAILLPILLTLQFLLGLVYLVYQVAAGHGSQYARFPFILHPILGVAAVLWAQWIIKPRGFARRWGNLAPLGLLALLLVTVLAGVAVAVASR